jgi:hypothetical protein
MNFKIVLVSIISFFVFFIFAYAENKSIDLEKRNYVFIKEPQNMDYKDNKIWVGNPKTGEVWLLDENLKVIKFNKVEPWKTKEKLKTVSELIKDYYSINIISVKKDLKKEKSK